MPKLIVGWLLYLLVYLVVFFATLNISALLSPAAGHELSETAAQHAFMQKTVGLSLILIPPLAAGLFAGRQNAPRYAAWWIAGVPVLLERLLLFAIGCSLVSSRFQEGWTVDTVLTFLQTDTPALFFTWTYIWLGLVSLLIGVVTASLSQSKRH